MAIAGCSTSQKHWPMARTRLRRFSFAIGPLKGEPIKMAATAAARNAQEIRTARQAVADELQAINRASELAKRRFTPEERGRINELKLENEALKSELDALTGEDEDREYISVLNEGLNKTAGRRTEPDGAFDQNKADEALAAAAKKDQGFGSFAHFLQAVAAAAIMPARADKRLRYVYDDGKRMVGDDQLAAAGMSESVPSDGGFLVQFDFVNTIIQKAYDIGEILKRIKKIPIGENSNGAKFPAIDETSRANGSRWGGVQAYWQAEASALTASKPKIRLMELDLKKLIALFYATDELLRDTTALEALVMTIMPMEIQFVLENSIINGTGAGQPQGIMNAAALVSVAKETGQGTNTVVFENVQKMWARMYAPHRVNSIWLIDQSVEPQLNAMALSVGTGGAPVYLPPGGLSTSPFSTLMGRPVIPVEYMAAVGTKGDIVLFDPTQYIAIEKGGLQSASSMHVKFLTDEMTYRFTYRFDGQPTWHSALTPYSGSPTWSPYVTLAARP